MEIRELNIIYVYYLLYIVYLQGTFRFHYLTINHCVHWTQTGVCSKWLYPDQNPVTIATMSKCITRGISLGFTITDWYCISNPIISVSITENITSNKLHECIIMHEKEGEAAWKDWMMYNWLLKRLRLFLKLLCLWSCAITYMRTILALSSTFTSLWLVWQIPIESNINSTTAKYTSACIYGFMSALRNLKLLRNSK